jgi:hypothetical protein
MKGQQSSRVPMSTNIFDLCLSTVPLVYSCSLASFSPDLLYPCFVLGQVSRERKDIISFVVLLSMLFHQALLLTKAPKKNTSTCQENIATSVCEQSAFSVVMYGIYLTFEGSLLHTAGINCVSGTTTDNLCSCTVRNSQSSLSCYATDT